MTRAMEALSLTSARERRRFGARSYQAPSRFLREVPEDLMEIVRPLEQTNRAPSERLSADGPSLDYSTSQELDGAGSGVLVGARVRHPVFGVGAVLAVIGDGLNQKLKIRFERAGVKTVMVRYANLEPA
jgi:DNA helicase-2/ATP-dependent DNA helicase PcrA